MHVFISYKHDDGDFAQLLIQELQNEDYETWIDDNIAPGDKWSLAIDSAIKASFALVVIMSPLARASEYVTYEWSFALGADVPVIPIIYKQTDLHPKLAELHYLNFTDRHSRPWQKLLDRLNQCKTTNKTLSPKETVSLENDIPDFVRNAQKDLESLNAETRNLAVEALAKSTHPRALEALVAATQHHMPDVKIVASFKLASQSKFEDSRAVPGLLEGLKERDSRISAIQVLGLMGDSRAVDALLQILGSTGIGNTVYTFYKLEERESAAIALGRIGNPRAIAGLMNALQTDNAKVGLAAVHALKGIDDVSIVSNLAAFLLNEAVYSRIISSSVDTPQYSGIVNRLFYAVIRALEHLDSSQNWELVGLRSVHSHLRQQMAERLGQSGNMSAVKALSDKLLDEDEELNVREACAKALGQLGDPSAVQVLLQVLDKPAEETFTKTIIHSLGQISSDEAVPKLLSMSANKNRFTNDASDAIRSMGDAAIPKLLELLDSADTSSKQKEEIINLLRQVKNFDEDVVLALLQALRDPEGDVRKAAENVIIKRFGQQHLQLFINNATSEDAWTRWVCAHCLGELGRDKAVPQLTNLLNDLEPRVVNKAKEALEKIDTPEAREALGKWRENHPEE